MHVFDALVVQRQREMVMVDHIQASLGSTNDRDHVAAEKFGLLLVVLLLPALLLGADFAHADRNLGRTQVGDRDGMQDRLTNRNHCSISLT